MRKLFTQAGYTLYLIDEYKTSKNCNVCESENESNFLTRAHPNPIRRQAGATSKVWGLLRCTNVNCKRIHNRDVNSALNMLKIVRYVIAHGRRPAAFTRE